MAESGLDHAGMIDSSQRIPVIIYQPHRALLASIKTRLSLDMRKEVRKLVISWNIAKSSDFSFGRETIRID